MTTFIHTFYTWLVANLLHPFVWLLYLLFGMLTGDTVWETGTISILFGLLIFSIALSLPCLFLGVVCLRMIIASPYTVAARFFTWIILAPLLIMLEFLVLFVLFEWVDMEALLILLPAIAATVLAIGIRYKQFKALFYPLSVPGDETHLAEQTLQ